MTDIAAGDGGQQSGPGLAPQLLRAEMQSLNRSIEKLASNMDKLKPATGRGPKADTNSIEQLADAVASLVTQMREEQKTVRQWAQGQQAQQNEIQRLLIRATGTLGRGTGRSRTEEDR